MQFYDVIENRKSIKKFKERDISCEKLDRMVKATMMAPSWKNNTSYKLILVKDKKKKDMLSSAVINKSDEADISLREAPVDAVMVAQPNKSGKINDKEFYLVDSAIAMEHFILSATEEGLGTCWIASLNENKVKEALSIPEEYRVVAMTPVGEIREDSEHYEEKDVRQYVFLDNYNNSYNYDKYNN